jgi:pimeloyl-ACP methyl ester carboxylesterase
MSTHPTSTQPALEAAPDAPRPAAHADRYVQAGALRLHYLDYGREGRTPMLCVHGGAAHGHWFDYIAGSFNADHHVLALDQRGHGDSEWVDPPAYSYEDYAADLDKFAQELDLRDFVLIGHSMGGMVSLHYAVRHPGRVKKLIIVDTTINMGQDRINEMRELGSRRGSEYATQAELIARFRLRPGSTLALPEVVRHIAGFSARQFPDGAWRLKFDRNVYATRRRVDGTPFWSEIRIPALLVKGDHSHRVTPQIQAEVKRRCPQIEFAEVARSDHHVTLDNPEGFAAAVRAFLARHP